MPESPVQLTLRPGSKHRVLRGHPWVFSNQLTEVPAALEPGAPVVVLDHKGGFVGRGYGHPNTLIAARILERTPDVAIDDAWLREKLQDALQRRAWMGRTAFRWVHGEADGLPGLIVDRYGDRAVLAANTSGMERLRPALERVLREGFDLQGALWKCDGRGRKLEGLPESVEAGWGAVEGLWTVEDDGLSVEFDPWGGQKTGLFLDMWENRRRMARALGSGRVVDLYSYVGQWGLHVARAGAEEVVCVDRSASAVERIEQNAERAGLSDRVRGVVQPVDRFLGEVPDSSLDGLVCDPPSFIRGRKDVSAGMRAYRTLFAHALRKVRPGGRAVLASCSHHLWDERFAQVVEEASRWGHRRLRVLSRGAQAPCHPVPTVFPEARYLKCWLVEVATLRS